MGLRQVVLCVGSVVHDDVHDRKCYVRIRERGTRGARRATSL